ncbi:hypothetical protein RJ640_014660 [Escallonia rubra]|uniref:Transmembrane protein n=1 Tax=Escallonia rubra TaxID=112253 RepID=A0AA88UR28_9ASTE|nr:hypothetical protein RJ640_014660 [Escallonia rubra]
MEQISSREGDLFVDLESGGTAKEEVGSPEPAKTFFNKLCSGFVSADGLVKGENGIGLSGDVLNNGEIATESVKLLINKKVEEEEAAEVLEKKVEKEKRKKPSAKKPPRPPRGLSLDAADQKLIKEIAEIAMMKRARIERMKALKKMKASKASSSVGNFLAMLLTILFLLVILFQGVAPPKSSAVRFRSSSESAGVIENQSASGTKLPSSGFLNVVEQVVGSNPEGKVSRAAG